MQPAAVGYWATVRKRAFGETLDLAKLADPGRALFLIGGIVVPAITGWELAGKFNDIAKGLSALGGIIAFFVLIYCWKLFSIPPQMDSSKQSDIDKLRNEIKELSSKFQSDLSIKYSTTKTVRLHPEEGQSLLESILVENLGSTILEKCVVKTGSKNRMNYYLFNNSWMGDASETFSLRAGEVRSFPILSFPMSEDNDDDIKYARLEEYKDGDYQIPSGREILDSDSIYVVHVDVLSANTFPAKMIFKVSHNGRGWKIQEINSPDIFD